MAALPPSKKATPQGSDPTAPPGSTQHTGGFSFTLRQLKSTVLTRTGGWGSERRGHDAGDTCREVGDGRRGVSSSRPGFCLPPPRPLHPLSKSIFSTMFLGLMLSSWLQMNTLPGSGSVHPYLLIQTFSCASEQGGMGTEHRVTPLSPDVPHTPPFRAPSPPT